MSNVLNNLVKCLALNEFVIIHWTHILTIFLTYYGTTSRLIIELKLVDIRVL